jgi:hypothetical protein
VRAHRYVRAYLAGIAIPTVVVCVAGTIAVIFFDELEPSVQRALILPIAINPVIWGCWNVVWASLGPPRRAQIGWHGAVLAVLLTGLGLLLAPGLSVSGVTPRRGAAVLVPTGFAYYILWRYGVSFLNSLVGVDTARDETARGEHMSAAARPTSVWTLQISLFAAAWMLIEYMLVGPLAVAYVPLFTGGFALWWVTARRTPIDPHTIIVPYLVTVIMFIAHVYEEYEAHLLGFADIVQGAPFAISFEMMLTFAASLAPILWLLGAVLMLKRQMVGFFIASTFLFGMMFIEPTHFITPFSHGGFHYVGGLFTAALPTACGWYTFRAIRRDMRRQLEAVE